MPNIFQKNADDGTPIETKIDDLYALIDDIDLCMMTTVANGALVSRPMSTQKTPHHGADLWFMTRTDTHKVEELEAHPEVNLAYFKDGEWVSISGTAQVLHDRALIHSLYDPSWKAWLEDNGGAEDGGPDDPRIALILVDIDHATYFKRTASKPVMYFQIAKATLTGTAPKLGEHRDVDGAALKDR